jgi:hypothetical protein
MRFKACRGLVVSEVATFPKQKLACGHWVYDCRVVMKKLTREEFVEQLKTRVPGIETQGGDVINLTNSQAMAWFDECTRRAGFIIVAPKRMWIGENKENLCDNDNAAYQVGGSN